MKRLLAETLIVLMIAEPFQLLAAERELVSMDRLLFAYQIAPFDEENVPHLEKLAAKSKEFISSPSSRGELSTPEGHELQARYSKLKSFLSIRRSFESCGQYTGSTRRLLPRILNSSAATVRDNQVSCPILSESPAAVLDGFDFSQIDDVRRTIIIPAFHGALVEQALKNATSAYLVVKSGYPDETEFPPTLSEALCQGKEKASFCGSELETALREFEAEYLKSSIASEKKRSSFEEVADQLQMSGNEVSGAKPHEFLLTTDVMRRITRRRPPLPPDVKLALHEVKSKLIKQARALDGNRKPSDSNLVKLVRANPVAVGQLLIETPEYAGDVCRIVRLSDKMDRSDETLDEIFKWTTIAAAGVLAVGMTSGLGAGGLAALGRVGVFATQTGAATIASLSAISDVAGLIAVAGFTADGIYRIRESQRAYSEWHELELAYLANSSDPVYVTEIRELMKEFGQSVRLAVIELAMTPIDVAIMIRYVREAKNLRVVAGSLKTVLEDPRLVRLFSLALRRFGPEKVLPHLESIQVMTPVQRSGLSWKQLQSMITGRKP